MERSDLIGAWELVTWTQEYDDGRIVHPLGQRPVGYIVYTLEGVMTCVCSANNRPPFTTGGQWDAEAAEKADAYSSMLAYSGSFEVVDGRIAHRVQVSLFPNWVGGVQWRDASLTEDGWLDLTARLEEDTPNARTARLRWARAT